MSEKEMKNQEQTECKMRTQIYNLVILDESGSMSSIRNAAISGFNETVGGIRQAQQQFGDTQQHFVSLMTFCACNRKMIYDCVPVDQVKSLTTNEYKPCCRTPLYDAMGEALNALYKRIHALEDATACVTIITDGMENASKEYNLSAIKALVDCLSNEEGWNFSYMGTNQDVMAVSMKLSIHNHLSFIDNEEGMKQAWDTLKTANMQEYQTMSACLDQEVGLTPEERKKARAIRRKKTDFFEK